ncbi:hypothetical protein IV498_03395 [Paenarthrobacter sp. Z7-10]|uniref:carbon-nitrogen hydrolase family protein n=1 Tax=Paenarthrobacter sp. Z7-10 TaxID=2787635 RepID=UPI0022A9653E|nr:nitrilase-related carbon-nitrogen hydrolase [Paenarthrobacter sp. Z7-10]MCZ2402249.1 hypothetical protein [Paenarthrobacter sp. Z7-10]
MAERQQAEVSGRPGTLTVGLLQNAPVGGQVDANIDGIMALRSRLGQVDLALTPELAVNGYGFGPAAYLAPLTGDDARLEPLLTGPTAMGIGFAEATATDRPRNAYLLADAGNRFVQHKIHPVSYPPWNEHLGFEAGNVLGAAEIRGVQCATVICNDMWHPVIPWLAAQAGAEVLIIPVASIEGDAVDHVQRTWKAILDHAALLLQCYVVFINRCGTDAGATFWGGSRILGPDGATLAEAGNSETTIEATLDLTALRALRARTPLLAEVRTDVVLDALSRVGLPLRVEMEAPHV